MRSARGTELLPTDNTRRLWQLSPSLLSYRKRREMPMLFSETAEQPGGNEEDLPIAAFQAAGNLQQFEFELGKEIIWTTLEAEQSGSSSFWSVYFFAKDVRLSSYARFQSLATTWKQATGHLSNMTRKCQHPAYQQIIQMGLSAIAPILYDLKESHSHWFWALSTITKENPISDEDAGNVPRMVEAWLQWGRARGYDV
jgi:hypothetical protein